MRASTGKIVCGIIVGIVATASANAYELGTHAALTEKAYEASVLATDPSLLQQLGIDIYVQDPSTS